MNVVVGVDRWMKQEFAEFFDEVAEREEARKARWAKHPELLEKMRYRAVVKAELQYRLKEENFRPYTVGICGFQSRH